MSGYSIIFDKVPETKYLTADNYIQYRAIMRLFYSQNQKMNFQLDKKTIMELLKADPWFAQYTQEQLMKDLDQLVEWKNLTSILDPHRVYTVSDFKNRQFRYMMSQGAIEVERLAITLENLYSNVTGLSSSTLRRIQAALRMVGGLGNMSLKEVGGWWHDLQDDFNRLSQNYQDYLREFYRPGAEKHTTPEAFIIYKQNLIRYLEEFIQDLQNSSTQIGAQMEAISSDTMERLLSLVYQSELEIPRSQSEMPPRWEEDLKDHNIGVWQSLKHWFTGEDATVYQVMEVTNEVIRRVVQNASLLVQTRNMGVSNKAELRHLLTLFAQCGDVDEAHKLSAQVFGAQQARHYAVNEPKSSDRIDAGVYEEPPLEYVIQPRVRSYKPRLDRSSFADKSAEKEAQRLKILEEQRMLRKEALGYIRNGILDFGAIGRPGSDLPPVSPQVRAVFLAWVAIANLNPDKRGLTEYGHTFLLRRKNNGNCRMLCTDGTLTMPNWILKFEANGFE